MAVTAIVPLILIVEDNPANLLLTQAAVARRGWRAAEARSAEEALDWLRTVAPDVILMDVHLPGMDGLTLARRLKADPRTSPIPIIALTARAMTEDRQAAADAGCSGYVTKPIDVTSLLETLDGVLRGSVAAPAGPAEMPDNLPVPARPADEVTGRASPSRAGPPDDAGRPPRATVLVVDDHPEGVVLLCAHLEREGYAVQAALTGSAALELAFAEPPDLIFLDVMLPDLDGYEVCRRLKAAGDTRAVPVVMVTALQGASERMRGLEAGADDFLSKPVDAAELLARARSLLRTKSLNDELLAQRREVERINAELEMKVAARTFDLRAANARLREELTAREAAETALRRSESRYRTLVDHFPNGAVILFDHDLRYIAVGGAGLAEVGLSSQILEGKTIWQIFPRETAVVLARRYLNALQGTSSEFEIPFADRVYQVRVVPVRGTDGTVNGGMAVTQDATQRKSAEAEMLAVNERLRTALAELEAAQVQVVQQERLRALGEMASGIAHDFNNALAPVVGFSELLLDTPDALGDEAKVRRQVEWIHTAAVDAAGVVRRLREFYRPREEGDKFGPVDLGGVVRQTITLTQPKWKDQAQAEGRTVSAALDVVPAPAVQGNEAELRELLTNLIFNAVDAMPEGGTLSIRVRPHGGSVLLEVADTGMGMTEEVRQKCLEPFFSTKGEHGTGLGLSMVHGTVRRHAGELRISSAPGAGTTFTIVLPMAHAPATPNRIEPRVQSPRRLRVLLVDDDRSVRAVHAAYLKALGHEVEEFGSGIDAIAQLTRGRFDLVVTDQAMPAMSGTQVAAAVKRISPSTPVVLLTGFGDFMQADERPPGIDVILGKPTSLSALRDAIAQVTPATFVEELEHSQIEDPAT